MPWRETRPMDQRKEFVREYRRGLYTMTEMAERYEISRKTGYALVRRVDELGMAGLQPQSRRPHTSPNRTPDHVAALLIDAKRFLLTCHGLRSVKGKDARPIFERTFREYGLPRAIRTDNGAPFVTRSICGLSHLNVWWMRLGIQHQRIREAYCAGRGRPCRRGR